MTPVDRFPRIVGYAAVWAFAVNLLWIPQPDPYYLPRLLGPAWYLWLCGFGFGAFHVLLSHRFRFPRTLLAAGMAAFQAEIALAMHGNTASGLWLALPFAAAALLAGFFSRPLPPFLHWMALIPAGTLIVIIGGLTSLDAALHRSERIAHSPDGAYSAFVAEGGFMSPTYFLYVRPRHAPVGWFTSQMEVGGYEYGQLPTALWSDARTVVVSGKGETGATSETRSYQDVTVFFRR